MVLADQNTESVNRTVAPAAGLPLPGPRGLTALRALLAMRRDCVGAFLDLRARYGDAIHIPAGRLDLALLNHPDHVAHVLQKNAGAYEKSPSYRELELVLGKGLLTSEGAFWKRQRRLAQPAFKRRNLAGFAPTMVAATEALLDGWAASPGPRDLAAETMRLALQIAGRTLFSAELADEADALGSALAVALPFVQHRTEALFNWPVGWPLPSHLRFRRALAQLDGVVHELIERRRRGAPEAARRDLLSTLVFARDPDTGERMDARQVRDEVMTFLLAGHETTANALAWTFYLLANHPEVEARVLAETQAVLGDRAPTAEDAPRLELTRRVVLDSMRLFPPAWVIERSALQDDVVGGFRVPKGTLVMLCSYTTHRHPDFWEEPDRFDPDRFLPERSVDRPRCAYFPFGAGQRQCIGEDFAMLEMLLIVPLVVRRFRLALDPTHRVEAEPGVTLRPRGGIRMTPHARGGAA